VGKNRKNVEEGDKDSSIPRVQNRKEAPKRIRDGLQIHILMLISEIEGEGA